jgi:predicted alpha/beta-hydrolase family hydrolase
MSAVTDRIETEIEIGTGRHVRVIRLRPPGERACFVFAHGAGAGMRHVFMETLSAALAARSIGTFRYEFLYMSAGRKSPDPQPLLLDTVQAAVDAARATCEAKTPLFAGGKSMGGRMTTLAASEGRLDVRGIVLVGFPLHPPGSKSDTRAEHLAKITVPMLFLQGTRDTFAEMSRMRAVHERLGKLSTLHVIETGDHSFHVLKSSGRTDAEVLEDLADTTANWMVAVGRAARA